MTATPDRILTQRHCTAMAALDSMPHIATRVRNLLSHGRRITTTQRYTYVDSPPDVTPGLTVDRIRSWTDERGAGIEVTLKPGLLVGFGLSAYESDGNGTEAEAWKRYHAGKDATDHWGKRRDMTEVTINGGLPGDGPARDDLLVIRYWNSDGVCNERVIAFDYGPNQDEIRDRLARHLFVTALDPDLHDAGEVVWGERRGNPRDVKRAYARADELLAVITETKEN